MVTTVTEQVKEFWETLPCEAKHASSPEGTAEFFDEVERRRYELEPFIADHARFSETGSQHVSRSA